MIAGNGLLVANFCAYIFFALWPTNEDIQHLRRPTLEIIGVDLSETPFFAVRLMPFHWTTLFLAIDSMFTLSTPAMLGMYWAHQINKTLKESSLSTQTKIMQRRMNQLLIMQTACPAFFLHTPALASYLMMYMGITSNNAIVYCSGILWMLYPVSSPLITIGFMKEYRTFFLKKIGLGVVSSSDRVWGTAIQPGVSTVTGSQMYRSC